MCRHRNTASLVNQGNRFRSCQRLPVGISIAANRQILLKRLLHRRRIAFAHHNLCEMRPAENRIAVGFFPNLVHSDLEALFIELSASILLPLVTNLQGICHGIL